MSADDIIVMRAGRLGRILLNRPNALNSLTLGMVRVFSTALDEFAADPGICAVLVKGAGERGLCAGGDIRALYESRDGRGDYKRFWREEYELNARIASFPKRYAAFMDGIVMGGGVGISAHGNRRVVTERTQLAMPETGIGFIPDVGGTWLLTRNGGAGIYMALSGSAVGAADAIHLDLADVVVDSEALDELEEKLSLIREPDEVDELLSKHAADAGPGELEKNRDIFDRSMRKERVEDVIDALLSGNSSYANDCAERISQKSPTSLKVTHALLKCAARSSSVEECLINEFRAACGLLERHDIYEGIRAAIIDKDKRPCWSPTTLASVDDSMVAAILRGCGDPEPAFWRSVGGKGANASQRKWNRRNARR